MPLNHSSEFWGVHCLNSTVCPQALAPLRGNKKGKSKATILNLICHQLFSIRRKYSGIYCTSHRKRNERIYCSGFSSLSRQIMSVSKQSSVPVGVFFFFGEECRKYSPQGESVGGKSLPCIWMPRGCKTGRKQLSRAGGRCFPDPSKPTCPRTLWFQQCRVSPCSPEQLTGSAPALLQLSQFPGFKREIQNTPSPPPPSAQCSWAGKGQAGHSSSAQTEPSSQGEAEKSRSGQLALLHMRSKFCILKNEGQLCPSYFNKNSRVIKIMIKWETRNIHSWRGASFRSNKAPPLVFLCISATWTHSNPSSGSMKMLISFPSKNHRRLSKKPKIIKIQEWKPLRKLKGF